MGRRALQPDATAQDAARGGERRAAALAAAEAGDGGGAHGSRLDGPRAVDDVGLASSLQHPIGRLPENGHIQKVGTPPVVPGWGRAWQLCVVMAKVELRACVGKLGRWGKMVAT